MYLLFNFNPVRIINHLGWKEKVWIGWTGDSYIAEVYLMNKRYQAEGNTLAEAVTNLWNAINA